MKGGTAINLFVRDMPRISVDLDLVFVDHRLEREDALARINEAIAAAADVVPVIIAEGPQKAMNRLHTRNGSPAPVPPAAP